MTVEAIARKNGPYVGDGTTATFAYEFRILSATEIVVYVNDQKLTGSQLQVTGVGSDTGGTVTLTAPPASGDTVWVFGETIKQQPTAYPERQPFPSKSHETGLDRPIMVTWELTEAQERTPRFAPSTLPALRNMVLPQPEPLKLWSWNDTGTGIVYVDSTILTVTPLPGGGARVEAQNTVAVPAVASAGQLKASSIVPAGGVLKALLAYNDVGFGTSNGLLGYILGTEAGPSRFGTVLPAQGAQNAGWEEYTLEPSGGSMDAILTAQGGPFDAVGNAIVTAVYDIYTVPTSVP